MSSPMIDPEEDEMDNPRPDPALGLSCLVVALIFLVGWLLLETLRELL